MTQNTTKLPKSFRLSPPVANLIAKAAKDTGLSEGEIVEGCVINQAQNVVARYEHLETREAVQNVAEAGVKRPRDERSDKGTKRETRVVPLKKRQTN